MLATRFRAVLLIVAVFLAGAAVGGAIGAWAAHSGARFPWSGRGGGPGERFFARRMAERLDLDAGQRGQLEAIIAESHERMRALKQEFRPRFVAVKKGAREEIARILTPEQREEFERLASKHKERRRRHQRRGPGPRGAERGGLRP